MPRYIAFLRAINVGGNRIIKMEHLRTAMTDAGFKGIATYIQSGNVLFDSTSTNVASLTKKLEKLLHTTYGFEVPVMLRTVAEMTTVIAQTPFPGIVPDKTLQIYVMFLSQTPPENAAALVASFQSPATTIHLMDREIYFLVRKELVQGPLDVSQLDKKLGIPGTVRNWATVNKVIAL
ncbi:DUF1697 domain-containing protein [Chitinophaga nivalis]|uniref:DUF1697 domain-containing protein n=1 Tax=Chitinophaga nivalis TaxID=2991709 RepID=A0ABT3ITE7_9BACT|nr:DUF1697 domain-containing protein [Chitinophaga nivalis]MCW3463053.1 DUF1697 domain-containing protein [Chitinophaga nivalis]MCW3487257.1 DUF1697 domain-containing protein [Chitinophaga nivalis]